MDYLFCHALSYLYICSFKVFRAHITSCLAREISFPYVLSLSIPLLISPFPLFPKLVRLKTDRRSENQLGAVIYIGQQALKLRKFPPPHNSGKAIPFIKAGRPVKQTLEKMSETTSRYYDMCLDYDNRLCTGCCELEYFTIIRILINYNCEDQRTADFEDGVDIDQIQNGSKNAKDDRNNCVEAWTP